MTVSAAARPPPCVEADEVQFTAIRAQGPGGQNVNKVATAVQLRFDIRASSLAPEVQARLLAMPDRRVNQDGVLVIKAQTARTQEQNRQQALARLNALIAEAAWVAPPRKPTRPTYGSTQRRLQGKAQRAGIKAQRGKVAL
jgi:ribosome-associated protein